MTRVYIEERVPSIDLVTEIWRPFLTASPEHLRRMDQLASRRLRASISLRVYQVLRQNVDEVKG